MTNEQKRISSLRDLPRDIQPPRDLWSGIEARIAQEPRGDASAQATAPTATSVTSIDSARRRPWNNPAALRVFAAAAMIATLAVGIWIGRSVLPGATSVPATVTASNTGGAAHGNTNGGTSLGNPAGTSAGAEHGMTTGEASAFQAAYLMDSRYSRDRAELVKDLDARLATLPPQSRAKVVASLKTISDSKRELENELGKDPSNALLQGLLVNTYQDEMRVLTAVHEAGGSGKGI